MNMNAHHCWAIITSNKSKADALFESIEKEYEGHIVRKVFGNYRYYVEFDDGHDLIWIKLSNSFRGYRFHRLWIDKDIDEEIIYDILAYCHCNDKDIVWV